MDIKIDRELKKICVEILKEGFSLDDWIAHESGDWFQSGRYVDGFDATENEFFFSVFENDIEYYFQFSLMDVERKLLMTNCEIWYNVRDMSYTNPQTIPPSRNWRNVIQTGVVLFKLRVVSLLLMASVGGAFLGAGGWPGAAELILVLLTGGMAAAGASALNQYIERDRDKKMTRTRKRPLPAGTIDQKWVPFAGINLIVLACIFASPFEIALSFFLLLGAFIYVVIYTIWLKPRTLLNIVIGGAAGSAAVMAGGAAVGQWQNPAVIVLALMLFLWTPSHFWSLAMLYRDDYAKADIPMLPTKTSMRGAAWWVMSHTLPTAVAAVLLSVVPELGWIYFVPVALASIDMIRRNVKLIRQPTPPNARSLFISSNIYLTIVLTAICLDTVLSQLF